MSLPLIEGTGDITTAMAAVTEAAAKGEITAAQGNAFARMVTSFLTAIDPHDFERRLSAVETAYGTRRPPSGS